MLTFCNLPAGKFLLGVLLVATTTSYGGVTATLGPATSNTTATGNLPSWNNNGDRQDATFSAYINFSPNNTPGSRQLIWESGGRINGTSLVYENNNTLRLRALQAGVTSELTWELTANQIASGELFVSWVIDLGGDELRLIMDGIGAATAPATVASVSFTGDDWTGGGAAAFGEGTSRVGGYPSPFAFFPDTFTSGSINTTAGLNYYQDQALLPSPVPEPLGALAGVAAVAFTCFRRRRPGL